MRQHWQPAMLVVTSIAILAGLWFAFGTSMHDVSPSSPLSSPVSGGNLPSLGGHGKTDPRAGIGSPCGKLSAGEICFSDGSTIQVTWRRPPEGPAAPPAPFAQHYGVLADKAQSGDTSSAYSLFEMLAQCRRAHLTETELSEAVERLHQTHQFQTPDMVEPRRIASSEKIPIFESLLQQGFQTCSGLTREQIEGRDAWLELASTGDLPRAKLLYGASLRDHNAALPHFEMAWAMGEIEALPLMATIYRHQYDTGEEPTSKVKAYAAYLAYTRLLETAMGPGTGHGQIAARQVDRVRQGPRERASELLQYELDEANRIAFEIVDSNKACCFGL